ncbi:MAG TPA: hypothetical protein VN721_13195 [Flavipsychrobacter sp.]|nr:hypothetical protein [Flavipsychrobacter sp.]
MDKNMINIDDLFRQRLGGGEEEEQSGAWLNMRELLDREIPTKIAGGMNWRRMLSYTAGLVLLAGVSLGGYELSSSTRNLGGSDHSVMVAKAANADNNTSNPSNSNISAVNKVNDSKSLPNNSNSGSNNSGANSNPDNSNTLALTAVNNNAKRSQSLNKSNSSKVGLSKSSNSTETVTAKTGSSNLQHIDNKEVASANSTGKLISNNNSHINNSHSNNSNSSAYNSSLTNVNNSTAKVAHKQVAHKSHATGNTDNIVASANKTKVSAYKKAIHKSQAAKSSSVSNSDNTSISVADNAHKKLNKRGNRNMGKSGNNGNSDENTFASSVGANNVTGHNDNGKASSTGLGNSILKDSIMKIDIIQHYVAHTGYYMDTVGISKIPEYKMEVAVANVGEQTNGLSQSGTSALQSGERVSGSPGRQIASGSNESSTGSGQKNNEVGSNSGSAGTTSNNSGNTGSSNNSGSAGTSSGNSNGSSSGNKASHRRDSRWTLANFNESLQNLKYNLGHVQFASGMLGGINATFFGSSTTAGFQLGMMGNFVFNEHWSVLTELKYFQRFNNGVLNDNYSKYDVIDSAKSNGAVTSYVLQKDSVQHYYNYSTLHSLELPISVTYTKDKFNIFFGGSLIYNFTINAVTYDQSNVQSRETYSNNSYTQSLIASKGPQVSLSDFNSRFGLGYLFGVSYNFTPAVRLDLRLTQEVWNNAKTDGAKQISNDLYKNPSAQISIGYFFNQSKKH